MWVMQLGANIRHTFASPSTPIAPPPGGLPEISEKLPLRFCAKVNRNVSGPVMKIGWTLRDLSSAERPAPAQWGSPFGRPNHLKEVL